jgi:hypothetical protein
MRFVFVMNLRQQSESITTADETRADEDMVFLPDWASSSPPRSTVDIDLVKLENRSALEVVIDE